MNNSSAATSGLRPLTFLSADKYNEYRADSTRLPNLSKGLMSLTFNVISGLLLPLLGTSAGSACVFLMKRKIGDGIIKSLCGFAAGVMTAASVWSLLLPATDRSAHLGKLSFLPPAIGFWLGTLFMILLNRYVSKTKSRCNPLSSSSMLVFSVTLHNIPEGMAVGAAFAGCLADASKIGLAQAMILAIGIAVQNFPEGAIISMPLKANGMGKSKSFAYGILSGAVEPVAAALTVIAANSIIPLLPYFLGFAAGAMIYAVITELIPESDSECATLFYSAGFTLMMSLDVSLS